MRSTKRTIITFATSTALAATLGLAACGNNAADKSADTGTPKEATTETTTEAASEQDSSVSKYDLTAAWVGMGDDNMTYYYEGSAQSTGAFLIYYTNDNTYLRWVGTMEVPAENQRVITDAESGERFSFAITATGDDGTIDIETEDGFTSSMSPMSIDEVGGTLDEVSSYATKAGEAAEAPSDADLGGEFLVQINTNGLGQVAYTQGGSDLGYGDSAFTHADAGEAITLSARADDGWAFEKWTKDGEDFSTDAEVGITVDGDAEYVAVFVEEE